MTSPVRLLLAAALVVATAGGARAQDITVGVYAPSAPFDSPVKRLEFANALARHLAGQGSKSSGVGRAYAKASDFTAAVARGDLRYAVVDAAYLAALGSPYQVLAVAVREGETGTSWQLVTSSDAPNVLGLKGKTIAVPAIGAKDDAFLTEVLFGGELPRGHFGKTIQSPDALSALAAVEHGRAAAACVPSGLELPSGVRSIATLPTISWPVLVALPGAPADLTTRVTEAAASFSGGGFSGFRRSDAEAIKALAGRFVHREHRGPLAVPALRLEADALLGGRSFSLPPTDAAGYARQPVLPAAR